MSTIEVQHAYNPARVIVVCSDGRGAGHILFETPASEGAVTQANTFAEDVGKILKTNVVQLGVAGIARFDSRFEHEDFEAGVNILLEQFVTDLSTALDDCGISDDVEAAILYALSNEQEKSTRQVPDFYVDEFVNAATESWRAR